MQPCIVFINEPGLYSLIMKSKMILAEDFQDWVYEEVLPSIGKYGEYKIKDEMIKFYSEKMNKIVEYKNNIIKIKEDYINGLEHIKENAQETARIAVDVINKKNEEINNMRPNEVTRLGNRNLLYMFALVKTYDPNHYDCYVIRCQRRNFNLELIN